MPPVGSAVHRLYVKLRGKGKSKGSAARIAQSATGLALSTGKPPKGKRIKVRLRKKCS